MLIPNTLHYIWLGHKPMHPLMLDWQQKWGSLHPGWQIKTWKYNPDFPEHFLACGDEIVECRHPAYLYQCPTLAKRSDVWRYDILEQHGGIYLDTDFEPIKCIEPLIAEHSAFAGLCRTRCDWSDDNPEGRFITEVGCAIVGSTAHHPWLQDLVQGIPATDPATPLSLAFPYITAAASRFPEVHLFGTETFYPISWDHYALGGQQSLYTDDELPEKTYAVHRWSSNWFANGLKQLK